MHLLCFLFHFKPAWGNCGRASWDCPLTHLAGQEFVVDGGVSKKMVYPGEEAAQGQQQQQQQLDGDG